jgi:GTPase
MKFVDEVVIKAKAGDGGNGIVAWRREMYVPKGGPAGGDGGKGGDIVFVADNNAHSLLDFRYQSLLQAKNGQNGASKSMYGKSGEDIICKVPVGTQVFDEETGELIADFINNHQTEIICKGGKGGLGNIHFVSSVRQAPEIALDGLPGEEKKLRLSLKLMADVGLVGFPNAGKSTLLASVSAAKPKIADYPFTTLVPSLGVVSVSEESSFVMADIPGLIEGASQGLGLGTKFLKHIERVRAICHLVAIDLAQLEENDLIKRYQSIRKELYEFNQALTAAPELVAISKCDLKMPEVIAQIENLKNYLDKSETKYIEISSATGNGILELKKQLLILIKDVKDKPVKKFDPLNN